MLKNKTLLCMICARGQSRRLGMKNHQVIADKHLIGWIADAAKDSGIFDNIVINTDSQELIKIAKLYNVTDADYIRPKHLASNDARVADAVTDMINWLEVCDMRCDYMLLITPCTPLVTGDDILSAATKMIEADAPMVVSVTQVKTPYTGQVTADGRLTGFSKYFNTRRQEVDCSRPYYLNNAIYMGQWKIFKHKQNFYTEKTLAYVMPEERSVDIDSAAELKLAEILIKERIHNDQKKSISKNPRSLFQ